MTGTSRVTPHLFAAWDRIARRIRENRRLAMFLDFDGTLVRIAPLPGSVRLEEGTRDVLRKLAAHPNVTLAVISGRQRAELQRYIGIRNMRYMGLYGWENNGNKRMPFADRVALVRALVSLRAELPSYPGVWIEAKRSTFSVHLKGASGETQRRVREQVRKRVKPLRETLKVMANLRDVEVAPVSIGDKGAAVRKFLDEPAMRGVLPIYFGDDFSDEPGFAAARKGISILVGKRRTTRAQFCLRGPAEVATALSRMEEIIR
ncbi:MAG TPA: trehalose-phosphatase [Candidatus Acidoferrales bacterium]|jgi:trehalose 6-phosphate phosphatase|nr:trehalose-phosphatase [Candidatus Acidoferrales bacterium]